ncbi:MAG: acyl-CoA dehydrogenase family protein, partial [Chloroflexota bacterium]|nr:acyl-CoA dehydrogenase family protein [Chloroflexota bacterium]
MNFKFTAEEQAFAEEVRQFLNDYPIEGFHCEDDDEGYGFGGWSFDYNRKIGEMGWINRTWPTDCYGQGRPMMDLFMLFRELATRNAPAEALFYTETVATGLIAHGSEELKKELLPPAATGEITFWEGFSEPGSGSDLFSLRTTAVEDGDDYIINGQKVWNSNAHLAHYGYTAARTDPDAPGHKGTSLFIIDMTLPGVTSNPLDDMAGSQSFSEIFFDDVRVPKRYLIGEKNKGLPLLIHGLQWDRFWGRCVKAPSHRTLLDELVQYCR